MTTCYRLVGLAILAVCLAGCSRGPERVPVRGRVTFEGEPVQRGMIRFLPDEHTEAPMSGAVILNGQYEVGQGGVPVGTHRIEIEAHEGGSTEGDVNVPAARQYLPVRYNKQSQLTLTVSSGDGPITKDFDLRKGGTTP